MLDQPTTSEAPPPDANAARVWRDMVAEMNRADAGVVKGIEMELKLAEGAAKHFVPAVKEAARHAVEHPLDTGLKVAGMMALGYGLGRLSSASLWHTAAKTAFAYALLADGVDPIMRSTSFVWSYRNDMALQFQQKQLGRGLGYFAFDLGLVLPAAAMGMKLGRSGRGPAGFESGRVAEQTGGPERPGGGGERVAETAETAPKGERVAETGETTGTEPVREVVSDPKVEVVEAKIPESGTVAEASEVVPGGAEVSPEGAPGIRLRDAMRRLHELVQESKPKTVVTEPAVVEAVREPVVTEPAVVEAVREPVVTEPAVVEAVREPVVTEPAVVEAVREPVVTEPAVVEAVREPVVTEPAVVEAVREPVVTEPAVVEAVREPVVTEPAVVEAVREPVVTEPAVVEAVREPVVTEPAVVEAAREPVVTEPAVVEAVREPVVTEPAVVEAVREPVVTEPAVVEAAREPVVTEPAVVEAAREPVVTERPRAKGRQDRTVVEEDDDSLAGLDERTRRLIQQDEGKFQRPRQRRPQRDRRGRHDRSDDE